MYCVQMSDRLRDIAADLNTAVVTHTQIPAVVCLAWRCPSKQRLFIPDLRLLNLSLISGDKNIHESVNKLAKIGNPLYL